MMISLHTNFVLVLVVVVKSKPPYLNKLTTLRFQLCSISELIECERDAIKKIY